MLILLLLLLPFSRSSCPLSDARCTRPEDCHQLGVQGSALLVGRVSLANFLYCDQSAARCRVRRLLGARCDEDAQCFSGACSSSDGVCTQCALSPGAPDAPTEAGGVGEACAYREPRCKVGAATCDGDDDDDEADVCVAVGQAGARCRDDAECALGLACQAERCGALVTAGAVCSTPLDRARGLAPKTCVDGRVCAASDANPVTGGGDYRCYALAIAAGAACGGDAVCAADASLFCGASTMTCAATKAIGAACAANRECASARCDAGGVCAPTLRADDDACANDGQCASQRCDETTRRCLATLGLGDACDAALGADACARGASCIDGVCVAHGTVRVGGRCAHSRDCQTRLFCAATTSQCVDPSQLTAREWTVAVTDALGTLWSAECAAAEPAYGAVVDGVAASLALQNAPLCALRRGVDDEVADADALDAQLDACLETVTRGGARALSDACRALIRRARCCTTCLPHQRRSQSTARVLDGMLRGFAVDCASGALSRVATPCCDGDGDAGGVPCFVSGCDAFVREALPWVSDDVLYADEPRATDGDSPNAPSTFSSAFAVGPVDGNVVVLLIVAFICLVCVVLAVSLFCVLQRRRRRGAVRASASAHSRSHSATAGSRSGRSLHASRSLRASSLRSSRA